MNAIARRKWPLWVAFAAAIAGSAMLALWFAPYWPATNWTVLPRRQLVAKAQAVAAHFGLNTSGFQVSAVPAVSKSLALYKRRHPEDAYAREVSPLSLQLKFSAKHGDGEAEVDVDSAGRALRWRKPAEFKSARKFSSGDEAANSAFRYLAGAQAALYGSPARSTGDEASQEEYVWKKPAAPRSELRERIRVVTDGTAVRSAQLTVSSSNEDEDSDTGDNQNYWSVLAVAFGLSCTAAAVAIIGIYALWLVRRAASHKFPLRLAGAALFLMAAALAAKFAAGTLGAAGIFGALFAAAVILGITVVGRGISAAARSKWMSLEQLCLLAPVAQSTGESVAAGVLFSPLLTAIPFLIAGCGLFPHPSVLARNADVLYSPAPLLHSVTMSSEAYLLAFFGFGLPALRRLLRLRWLYWLVLLPIGIVFFADQAPVITGPLIVPLTAGLCAFASFWFVYAHFDLLAVLTLQLASGLLLSFLTLLHSNIGGSGTLAAALAGLLLAAFWFSRRGKPIAEGDPRATVPALADFRAEREKLKAEFSVARRAQQDMLPQTPPALAGYSIAASCTPSLEVGGDLYDFLKLPDGRIGIGVADVSGKGVPAALYMTLTKGLLASITKNNAQLAGVVEEVNRHLHGVTRKKVFVTLVLGFLDPEKRLLECVRAGHNPVVWRQAASNLTTLVAPGGLGLGITASKLFSAQLKVAELALTEGDAVVFYSDGITEAMNSGLEQFGEERLMNAVEKTDNLDAAASRDSILGAVKDFLGGVHPQDDMTLVVLRVGSALFTH